jgi:hypothetical protein
MTTRLGSALIVLVLCAGVGLLAWRSTTWQPEVDLPLAIVGGRLMVERAAVPYRDFFDMNPPGAWLAAAGLVWATAGDALALRLVDLGLLAILVAGGALVCRRADPQYGALGGACGSLAFAQFYLGGGPGFALEREYLLLLPLLATVLALAWRDRLSGRRAFAVGLGVGLATLVKPTVVLLLPWAAAVVPAEVRHRRVFGVVSMLSGVAAPLVLVLGWLWTTGALGSFLDIATRYWPLYAGVSARPYHDVDGMARGAYAIARLGMLSAAPLLGPGVGAAVGVWLTATRRSRDPAAWRVVRLLAGIAGVGILHAVLSVKGWPYQWLLYAWSACLLTGYGAVVGLSAGRPAVAAVIGAAWLWAGPALAPAPSTLSPDQHACIGAIRASVESLDAADTVQPLDWTGVALAGLTTARTGVATSFLEDVHFYHHVHSGYVAALRHRLIVEMSTTRPRLIVDVHYSGWREGPERSRPFGELRAFIASEYAPRWSSPGCTLWERGSSTDVVR